MFTLIVWTVNSKLEISLTLLQSDIQTKVDLLGVNELLQEKWSHYRTAVHTELREWRKFFRFTSRLRSCNKPHEHFKHIRIQLTHVFPEAKHWHYLHEERVATLKELLMIFRLVSADKVNNYIIKRVITYRLLILIQHSPAQKVGWVCDRILWRKQANNCFSVLAYSWINIKKCFKP